MLETIRSIPLKGAAGVLFILGLIAWAVWPSGSDPVPIASSDAHTIKALVDTPTAAPTWRVAAEPYTAVDIVEVQGRRVGARTVIGGTVIPAVEVTLTAQLPGEIKYLGGIEGDYFSQNSVLVAIDADDLRARRDSAIAQLRNAAADIRNAEVQYQREMYSPQSRSLSRSGGMGVPMMFDQMFTRRFAELAPGDVGGDTYFDRRADLYSAGTRLDQAEGRYRQIESQIEEIEAKIADSLVYTPFPGVILERMVETGDTIQVGTPMIRYAETGRLQIESEVPTRYVRRLGVDMILPIRTGDGEPFGRARVAQIYPTASAQRRTVTVKFDLEPGHRAIPGLYVELLLSGEATAEEPIPVIPHHAVRFNGSLPSVRILGDDGRLYLRMIRLGEQIDSETVAVISGLRVGERILRRP